MSKKKAAKKKAAARKASAPAKKHANPKSRTATGRVSAASKKVRVARKSTTAAKPTPPAPAEDAGKLAFNHAMIYLKDVGRGIAFYRDWLGFKVIEDFRHEGHSVYARLRAPGGDGTLALHQAGPGASVASDGVRLYFELRDLDDFCQKLRRRGFVFTQLPQVMPWGWRHAYLNDTEGHEISLYWAGDLRMKKSVMKVAREAEATD